MKKSAILKSILISCVSLLLTIGCFSQNWQGWRGENRDGKVKNFNSPQTWPAELTIVWHTAVGLGDSSPVLKDGKIYLFVKQDNDEVAMCLDANTGKQIWKKTVNTAPEISGPASSHPGPRSTPFITEDKIYLLGAGGIFSCLNSNSGEIIWQNKDYKEVPQFYTSASPLISGEMCIIHLGGNDNGTVVAFNKNNGEIIWQMKGEPCTYSSPVIMNIENEEVLVVQSETDLAGVSMDGKLLWKIPTPVERRFYNSSTPIIDGQNIIIAGQGKGTFSLKIQKTNNSYSFKENWNNPEFGVSFNTPVLKDGYIYGSEGRLGKLFCLDAATGKTCWSDTTTLNRFASTLDLGKVMLVLTANGEMIIYEPNHERFVQKASYTVSNTEIYAHPLVTENKFLVKDKETLTCWVLK